MRWDTAKKSQEQPFNCITINHIMKYKEDLKDERKDKMLKIMNEANAKITHIKLQKVLQVQKLSNRISPAIQEAIPPKAIKYHSHLTPTMASQSNITRPKKVLVSQKSG